MGYNSEYTAPAVQGGACSYATLSHYYNNSQGVNALPKTNSTSIVPSFSPPPGYNTVSQVPTCSGYANLKRAYGTGNGGCGGQFVSKLCQ